MARCYRGAVVMLAALMLSLTEEPMSASVATKPPHREMMLATSSRASLLQWRQPTAVEALALVPALALMWMDVRQTRKFRRAGVEEDGPAVFWLGSTPTPGEVFWKGGVLPSLLLIVVWYALPAGWRMMVPAAVFGAEMYFVVQHNWRQSGISPFGREPF